MEFKLKPEKIEKLEYMLSRVFEKDQSNKPKFCFLLGAGCSAYSGIPLGWGVIERCRTIVFLNHHPLGSKVKNANYSGWHEYYHAAEKFRDEKKAEFDQFVVETEEKFRNALTENEVRDIIPDDLEKDPDFKLDEFTERVFNDRLYGFWLDKYDEDPRERQMFIEHVIEDVEPAGDYILFASLVEGQIIHNVLTTNFDDLLNEALINYYNNRARVYAHNEMARFISPVSKRPNIIKLHGDYLYENIKNTNIETGDLEANMKSKFSEILNRMNLVVVGYGGADHSVMSVLELVKKDNKYCLIWCGSDPEKLNWRVIHLINSTKNSFFVPVSDFQTMVFKLWTNADLKLPDFEADLKVKKSRLEDFLTKYKEQVKDRDEVTQKEMNVLIDRTEALKWFNKAYDEKDFGKQVEYYSKAIEFNPKDHLAYYNRAFAFNELSEFEKAIKDLNVTLEIDASYTNAYINRGLALYNLKQYDKAISDYTQAIKLDPESALAYNNRGLVFYDTSKFESARLDFTRAIELNPSYTSAILNRGLVFYDLNQLQNAINDFTRVIEIDSQYTNAYINRGLSYNGLKKYELALADLNRAAELNPTYSIIYNNRGNSYNGLKQNEKAMEDYTKAIELAPDNSMAYGNRGLIYHEWSDFESAMKDYSKALELNPNYTDAYINRGLAKYNLNRYDEAILDYTKAIELKPDYTLAYSNRGLAYYDLLQYEESVNDFNRVLDLDPDNAAAYCNRGAANFELGRFKQAIDDYKKSIELDANYLIAYQNLSEVFLIRAQYPDAEKIIDIALKLELTIQDKSLMSYLKVLAVTLLGKDNSEFIAELEKLLKEDFKSTWNLTQIENWISEVDLSIEKKKVLQSLTEKMKGKT